MLHTRHAASMHMVIGVVLVLVAQGGKTLTSDSEERNKNGNPAWTMGSSLIDRNQCRKVTVRTSREQRRFQW